MDMVAAAGSSNGAGRSAASAADPAARWRRLVRDHGARGSTVRAFCRDRGLSEHSFYVWRRKLGQTPARGAAPRRRRRAALVPVRLAVSSSSRIAPGGAGAAAVEILRRFREWLEALSPTRIPAERLSPAPCAIYNGVWYVGVDAPAGTDGHARAAARRAGRAVPDAVPGGGVRVAEGGEGRATVPGDERQPATTTIYVDADGCPVKDEVYAVARRYGLVVKLVSNSWMRTPSDGRIELVVVGDGFDEADDWIAARAGTGDVVVTADIPLAARCLANGARALGPKGRPFTEDSIGTALAGREASSYLRDLGIARGGPAPFAPRDRSKFLQALDAAVQAARRR